MSLKRSDNMNLHIWGEADPIDYLEVNENFAILDERTRFTDYQFLTADLQQNIIFNLPVPVDNMKIVAHVSIHSSTNSLGGKALTWEASIYLSWRTLAESISTYGRDIIPPTGFSSNPQYMVNEESNTITFSFRQSVTNAPGIITIDYIVCRP